MYFQMHFYNFRHTVQLTQSSDEDIFIHILTYAALLLPLSYLMACSFKLLGSLRRKGNLEPGKNAFGRSVSLLCSRSFTPSPAKHFTFLSRRTVCACTKICCCLRWKDSMLLKAAAVFNVCVQHIQQWQRLFHACYNLLHTQRNFSQNFNYRKCLILPYGKFHFGSRTKCISTYSEHSDRNL